MLYIIGTYHCTQYIYRADNLNHGYRVEEFAAYLREQAIGLHIELLAEELSKEAITQNMNCAIDSNARRVAAHIGIAHVFCDPDSAQRKILGIPSEREIREHLGLGRVLDHDAVRLVDEESQKHWSVREELWLNCMSSRLQNNILFVCGESHVRRFADLVLQHGHQVQILIENWYANPGEITPPRSRS